MESHLSSSNPCFTLVRNRHSLQHFDEEEYRQACLYWDVLVLIETAGYPIYGSMLGYWQRRALTYMEAHPDLAIAVKLAFNCECMRRAA